MPVYKITGLNGKSYSIDGPPDATQAQIQAQVIAQDPDAGRPPKPGTASIMGRAFVRGAGHIVGGLATPVEDVSRYLHLPSALLTEDEKRENRQADVAWKHGVAPVADWLRGADKGITNYVGERQTKNLADTGGLGEAAQSIAETVSEGAVPTVAAAATTFVTKNPYAGMAVMGLTSAPQTYSGIRQQQEQEKIDDPLRAVVGTIASTSLDILTGEGSAATHAMAPAIKQAFEQGLMPIVKHVLKTGLEEGVTESIQNVIEQVAGGADPRTKQSLAQTFEAGVAGLVGGHVFGTLGHGTGAVMANRARAQVKDITPIHTIEIERKVKGKTVSSKVDIISAPDEDGNVIARAPTGKPFEASVEQLDKMRTAPASADEAQEPLATILGTKVAARREAAEQIDAHRALSEVVANTPEGEQPNGPEYDAAFKRFNAAYGIPEQFADTYAREAVGLPPKAEPVTYPTPKPLPTAQELQVDGPLTVQAEPTPETVAAAQPEPKPVGFTTAKGSTYEIGEDGTTTRNKAFRPEHGVEEQGPQPTSEATYYVTPKQADALSLIQTQGGGRMAIQPTEDGTRIGVRYLEGKDAGKIEKRTAVEPSRAPAVGLIPVETWQGGERVHFGNEITEVHEPGAAPVIAPSETPEIAPAELAPPPAPAPPAEMPVAETPTPPPPISLTPQSLAAAGAPDVATAKEVVKHAVTHGLSTGQQVTLHIDDKPFVVTGISDKGMIQLEGAKPVNALKVAEAKPKGKQFRLEVGMPVEPVAPAIAEAPAVELPATPPAAEVAPAPVVEEAPAPVIAPSETPEIAPAELAPQEPVQAPAAEVAPAPIEAPIAAESPPGAAAEAVEPLTVRKGPKPVKDGVTTVPLSDGTEARIFRKKEEGAPAEWFVEGLEHTGSIGATKAEALDTVAEHVQASRTMPEELPLAPAEGLPQAPVVAPREATAIPEGATITKVAPGDAYGARPVARGTQGKKIGAAEQGAKALTRDMRSAQKLREDLTKGRERTPRVLSAQDEAHVIDMLRERAPHMTKGLEENHQQALREVAAARKKLDTAEEAFSASKNALPAEKRAALAERTKARKTLMEKKERVVEIARAEMERRAEVRAGTDQRIAEALLDENLTPAQHRELMRQKRENLVVEHKATSVEDPDRAYADAMTHQLEGRPLLQAIQWAVHNAPTKYHRVIANAVGQTFTRMQNAGINFEFRIIHEGDVLSTKPEAGEGPWGMQRARGMVTVAPDGQTVRVWLNGPELLGKSGMSYETLLHELVHAVTLGAITHGNRGKFRGTHLNTAINDLFDIQSFVVKRLKAKIAAGEELSPFEQQIVNRQINAVADENEILAWALTNSEMQDYLDSIEYTPKQSVLGRLVDALRRFLRMGPHMNTALTEVLRVADQIMLAPDEELKAAYDFTAELRDKTRGASAAQQSGPEEQQSKGADRAKYARDAHEARAGATDAAKGHIAEWAARRKDDWTGLAPGALKAQLFMASTSTIKEKARALSAPVGGVLDDLTKLHEHARGMTNKMKTAMRRRVKEFQQFASKAKKPGMLAMHDVMTEARVNRFNPLEYTSRAEALAKDPLLKKYEADLADPMVLAKGKATRGLNKRKLEINSTWSAWEKLGKVPGGHEMYAKVRQFYKDMYVALRSANNSMIDSFAIDDAHKAELKRIAAEADMNPDSTEGLTEDDDAHPGVRRNLFPAEYFPFRRFGDYALVVKGAQGKHADRERYHFDTARQRNTYERQRMAEAKAAGWTQEEIDDRFERFDGLESIRRSVEENSSMLRKMFSVINNAKGVNITSDADAEAFRKQLKDRLYQSYLQTLPERSIRKQFMHAEHIRGQSADVLRVFRASAGQFANTLPKMIYNRLIDIGVGRAHDVLPRGNPAERSKLRMMVNAYVGRMRETMDSEPQPKGERILNAVTFTMLMTSMMSAAAQPFSMFQALPRQLTKYNPVDVVTLMAQSVPRSGWVKAFMHEDPATGDRYFGMPSLGNTAHVKNNALRSELWQKLNDERDLFSQKHTDDTLRAVQSVFGPAAHWREGGPAGFMGKVASTMALPFSAADQVTREAAGMAFAELEYKKLRRKGMSHDEAIAGATESAIKDTNDTIGDFTPLDKPGFLRGGPKRRMAGFLRSYAFNRSKYFWQTAGQMWKGAGYKTKLRAGFEVSGSWAMGALLAGIPGAFGYTFICQLIDAFYPMFFTKEENERRRRDDPLGADDVNFRLRQYYIPHHFGSLAGVATHGLPTELTGADIGTRLSQNELWIRSAKTGDTAMQSAENFIDANLSPHLSSATNMVSSIDDFGRGDFLRGTQKLVPAIARGAVVATRLAKEGERAPTTGKQIMGDFTPSELVWQALGATPSRLSDQRAINRFEQGWQARAHKQRQALMDEFSRMLDQPEIPRAVVDDWMQRYQTYQASIPPVAAKDLSIDPADLVKSFTSKAKDRANSIHGVSMTPGEALIFGQAEHGGAMANAQ